MSIKWLNLDKSLPTPLIIDSPTAGGGYYVPSIKGEEYIDGRYYNTINGIIVYNSLHGDKFVESTLAHEYRHHWQHHHGVKFIYWPADQNRDNYEKHIYDYYQMPYELDALLYQTKMTNEDWSQYWLSILDLYTPKVLYSIPTY